jgi:hypothetical protein
MVKFKTKIIEDSTKTRFFKMKKRFTRSDYIGDHKYINSDIFPAYLMRELDKITKKKIIFMDDIPKGITVDDSAFLAIVTIDI